jgi:hypothetical protein
MEREHVSTTPDPTALPGLAVRVTLADGGTHDLRVVNPDRIRYDLTRQREKWPAFREAPFIGMTFLAWAALTRTAGRAVAGTWEEFSAERCVDVTDLTAAGGADDAHPSRPAHAAGS